MSLLSVSPYALMLGYLETKAAMRMQRFMSNAIIFLIKEEAQGGGKRQVSGREKGSSGLCSGCCHSMWPRATWWSVWDHFFALDFIVNKTSQHHNSHWNPQPLVGGTVHITTSPVRWESFDRMTHTLPFFRKVNSLPGHERQFPTAASVMGAVGTWSQLGSLGKAAIPIITPAALFKGSFPGFDRLCRYCVIIIFAGAETDAGLSSIALGWASQDGWGLSVGCFCVVPEIRRQFGEYVPRTFCFGKQAEGLGCVSSAAALLAIQNTK